MCLLSICHFLVCHVFVKVVVSMQQSFLIENEIMEYKEHTTCSHKKKDDQISHIRNRPAKLRVNAMCIIESKHDTEHNTRALNMSDEMQDKKLNRLYHTNHGNESVLQRLILFAIT